MAEQMNGDKKAAAAFMTHNPALNLKPFQPLSRIVNSPESTSINTTSPSRSNAPSPYAKTAMSKSGTYKQIRGGRDTKHWVESQGQSKTRAGAARATEKEEASSENPASFREVSQLQDYLIYLENNRSESGVMNACVSLADLELLGVWVDPLPLTASPHPHDADANLNLDFNFSMDGTFNKVFNLAREVVNHWEDEKMLLVDDNQFWPNFTVAEIIQPKGTDELIAISCHIGSPCVNQILNSEMLSCCYLDSVVQARGLESQEGQIERVCIG
ncbi:hypothetical protein IFR05_008924 [Cadophora sp. M221]|nr:hypothetical protein IFR05_008924 [Cadophora sp. M221]